ncbi:MAG: hypothetical protein JWQ93_2299 [Marmoricola sp.]|nr:hypothetical protein [Marmoricola sp.]
MSTPVWTTNFVTHRTLLVSHFVKPSPIVTYPLRRARGYAERLARRNALTTFLEAATRRAERDQTQRFIDEELPSSDPEDRNRQIQQFLDDRLAGIPRQRSAPNRGAPHADE